jgi:hypothetical protein
MALISMVSKMVQVLRNLVMEIHMKEIIFRGNFMG